METNEVKKVYILLTNTGSLLSKSIKIFTKEPYNHVSLVLNDEFTEIYSFGRLKKENPVMGGFVNEFETKIYDHFEKTKCLILRLDVTETQYQKLRSELSRFEYNNSHFKYNIVGYAGFVVNYPIKRKDAYFCSQFVGEVLQNAEIINFSKPIELLRPYDFTRTTKTKKVYEGSFTMFVTFRRLGDVIYDKYRLAMIN